MFRDLEQLSLEIVFSGPVPLPPDYLNVLRSSPLGLQALGGIINESGAD